MSPRFLRLALCACLSVAGTSGCASPQIDAYPTVDRVLYVQECMRAHPGPHYEMVNKCSCAFDGLAKAVSFDDYVSMNTAANANSIGGERGSYIRDTEMLQGEIKRFRELQTRVKSACFINTGGR